MFHRFADRLRNNSRDQKKRLAAARRRRSKLDVSRFLQVEPLESRRLLTTLFWQGDTSNLWSNAANWNTAQDGSGADQAPRAANGDVLIFDTDTPGVANFNNSNDIVGLTDIEIQIVDKDFNGFQISGNTVTLAANGVSFNSTFGDAQIIADLTLPFANTSFSATGAALNLGGVIDGAGGISKAGNGLLQLIGANTYTGVTSITGGGISAQNDDGLGATAGNTVVAANALLDVTLGINTPEPIALNGGVIRSFSAGANNTISGTLTLGADSALQSFEHLTITGQITGGFGFTKTAANVLTLSNPTNDYGGATNISAGTLTLGASDVIPNTSDVTVNGILDLAGFSDDVASLRGGGTVANGGTLTVIGSVSPGISGPADLAFDGTLNFSTGGSFDVQINGTTPGTQYDQLIMNSGTANLNNAQLVLTGSHTPVAGDIFGIITGTTSGTFTDSGGNTINDGDTLLLNGAPLEIDYASVTLSYDPTPVINVTPGADDVNVTLNGADVEVRVNGGLVMSTPVADLTDLTINGGDGDDTFTIDLSGGVIPLPITFNGDGNVSSLPGDQIMIVGGAGGNDFVFNYTDNSSGSIQIDGGPLINYTGLEPITSTVTPANVTLNYSGASETINVVDSGGGATVTVDSNLGETTTFPDPTNSLMIDTGSGADTVNVNGLNIDATFATFDADLIYTDTVNFNTAATNVGTGDLQVAAETVNINQPISAGTLLITSAGSLVSSTTINAPTITTTGFQVFNDPVMLAADLVLSGSSIIFNDTVDGGFNLTLNDDGPSFFQSGFVADVGGSTPLASVTTDAAGVTMISGNVTTTGAQTYHDAVVTDLAVSLVGNTVNFSSTLDNFISNGTDLLTVNSTGAATFGGAIGGGAFAETGAFASLNITTGGPFVLGQNMTVNGDISISVTDLIGDTDDLTINNAAVITSSAGNVTIQAGDDFTLSAGASISAPGAGATLAISVDQDNADAGTGSTVTIDGVVSGSAGITVTGGADTDTLAFSAVGGSGVVDVSPTQIDINFSTTVIDYSSIEAITVNNANRLFASGTAGDDTLTLRSFPGTNLNTITYGTGLVITVDRGVPLNINGAAGNDTLIYDITTGLPPLVEFVGGLSVSPLDQIIIQGANPVGTIQFDYINDNDGYVTIDGSQIGYVNFAPLTSTVTAANVILNYSGVNETIEVSQSGGDVTVDSLNAGEITTFVEPTGSLTINTGGGTDIVNVNGLNFASGNLSIVDGDSNDTLNFQTAPTNLGTGALSVTALNTNINQPLTADSVVVDASGGRVTINTPTITTTNTLSFSNPVDLAGDLVATGSGVVFNSTVDGAFNLTVNDPTANVGFNGFFRDIGGVTPLASLTTDAGGATSFGSLVVNTTGAQTYGDAIVVGVGTTHTFTASVGAITFGDTLDAAIGDTILINSAGVASFGGAIGAMSLPGTGPIAAFAVNTAGPFVLNQNATADGNLAVVVADTAADTDDLTIAGGAVITSGMGNISLRSGDDLDIQAGTSIDAALGFVGIDIDPAASDADLGNGASAVIAGTVTTGTTVVRGGNDPDTFTPTLQATTFFDIGGGTPSLQTFPGDVLNLDVAGSPVAINPLAVNIAGISGTTISYAEIETFNLTNSGPVAVAGDALNNVLTLYGNGVAAEGGGLVLDAGPNVNFSAGVPISLSFDGQSGDDALVIDETLNGLLPVLTGIAPGSHSNTAYLTSGLLNGAGNQNVGIHFEAGPSGAANNDRLEFLFSNPHDLATFDDNVPIQDNSGVVNIGGVVSISYDSLAPIVATGAGGTFTADASALPAGANLDVADDLLDTAGAGGNVISSLTPGFEDRFVSGFDNLVVRSGLGGNLINLVGLDPLSTETAITLDADDISDSDVSNDEIRVQTLPATVTATLLGGAGGDLFNISDAIATVDNVLGQVIVSPVGDEPGAGDVLNITNNGSLTGNTVVVTNTTINGITGSTLTPQITYNGGDLIETVNLVGSDNAADIFNIQSTQAGSTYFVDTGILGAVDDVVNISSDAPTNAGNLNGIQGQLNIGFGSGANTSLNISDAGDVAGDAYDLILNPATLATEIYFNDGGATVGTLGFLAGGTAVPDIIYNAFGGNLLANFSLTGSAAGNNDYNLYELTATASNTISDGAGDSTFNIQGDNLALGSTNTFNGAGGEDVFNVNFGQDLATPGGGTSFQINGGSPATSSVRDAVFIQAAAAFTPGTPGVPPVTAFGSDTAPRTIGLTYADATKTSGDLDVTDALTTSLLDLNQVETVAYIGDGGNDDIVSVTGTTADDDLSVAPYAPNAALVFLDGDPWDGPSEGSQFDQFPGVAGGSSGPDLEIVGADGMGVGLVGGGAGAAGDQLYVYAPSEADLIDAATTSDPFGFGIGVILPGSNNNPGFFPSAYDAISVATVTSVVTITNDRPGLTPSVLLPVVPLITSFAQGDPAAAGLIVNAGFETNPSADGIGDDMFAFPSSFLAIQINGGDPDASAAPNGDRLQFYSAGELNVYSDKSVPPNVSVTSPSSGAFPVGFSSIENLILTAAPGSERVNLIGDNNDPTVDQNDNFVVVGRDVDSMLPTLLSIYGGIIDPALEPDGDGDNEFVLQINGSPPIAFRNVTDLNVFGDDRPDLITPGTPSIGPNDIDTLEITPYADDTPQGWGITVSFDEGNPAGADGAQADLLIVHTSAFGTDVSEDIVIRPSGPDAGQVEVTNANSGTSIVDINYVNNTDIIVLDDDGFVTDSDTLTLLGTDPANPDTSGDEAVIADFSAAGGVGTPWISVRDGNNILYNVRNTLGFGAFSFDLLDGNDSLAVTPDTANVNGLQNLQINDDGGVGQDTLSIDGNGANVLIDATALQITVDGTTFNFPNNEAVNLSNVGTLTVNGTSNRDVVTFAGDPNVVGGDLLTINSGVPIAITSAASLVFNGSGGDDDFVFDATGGMPTTPVTFNGQDQDGLSGGDFLAIVGLFTTQTLNYAAAGINGNNGTVNVDGTVITYTGLEPINAGNSVDTILNFLTGDANNATLQDNVAAGFIEIVDNGTTFEDTVIPNPTNSLTINLGDQGDMLTVLALDAAYAASMIINGGVGVDVVQVNNVTISNTPGRGLDVAGVETLGIADSTFSNNVADVGGGLRVIGGNTTIINSTFTGNTATGDAATQGGGGIFSDGMITIQNGSLIDGNAASGVAGSGGGILVGPGGTLIVNSSTISNNTANRAGGGIETQSGNDLTLTNVILLNNNAGVAPAVAAPGNGGGLHVTGDANVSIVGGTITGNRAAAEGGGLWNDQGTMIIGGGTTILMNIAAGDLDPAGMSVNLQGGGGIFNNGGTLNINNLGGGVTIQDNQASGATFGSGGGIMSIGGNVNVTGALVERNEAVRAGGGIEVITGNVMIVDTVISNNDVSADDLLGFGLLASPGNGGGLHITGAADVTIDGGSVDNNRAEAEGGGLWNSATGTLTVTGLNNAVSINNNFARGDTAPGVDGTAVQGGGGIFNNGGTLVLTGSAARNVTVQNNFASGMTNGSGGGILSVGGNVTIDNSIINANEAVRAGGGIELVEGTVLLTATEITSNDVSVNDLLGFGLGASPGNGGGLHVTGAAAVTINGGTIASNGAEREGGALWNGSGMMTIQNGAIIDNNTASGDAADDGGGGIFNNGGTLVITGAMTTISNNRADGTSGSGGGIFNNTGGTVSITDATISGNVANRAGGGIEDASGAGLGITLTSVAMTNNNAGVAPAIAAPGNGGGLHVTGPGDVLIDGGTYSDNIAALEGGALWNGGGTMTIQNGAIIDNNTASGDAADDGGGGIFNNGGTLVITGAMTTISNNRADGASGSGGGIFNNTGGTVSITDATISGNVANRAGGGIEDASGAGLGVTLSGGSLVANNAGVAPAIGAPGNGGGLHVTGAGDVTIDGTLVQGNVAALEGGGLWNGSGTMTVQNGAMIENNTASGNALDDGGGGIFNNGGTLVISGLTTVVRNNQADGLSGRGGGIFSGSGGPVSITDATIEGNTASIDGGGLFAEGTSGTVTLTGAAINLNVAGDSGGGVFVDGPTITIDSTSFTNNQAQGASGLDGDGGGLFVRGQAASGDFSITNTTFLMNRALGGGGGAFFIDVDGTIDGGSYTSNQVIGNGTTFDTGGGGITIIGELFLPSVGITGVTIDGNTAPSAAGIGIVDSVVTIDNTTISNNTATESLSGGGGIGAVATVAIAGDSLVITSSQITGNTTTGEGGGIGFINGDLSITDTTIAGNRATGGRGGGIGLLNNGIAGTATIRSTTISANTASLNGGGIAVLNMGIDLENVTLSGNDAGSAGGGIAYDNNVGNVTRSIRFSTTTSNTSLAGGSNISATGSPIDVTGSIFNDGVIAAPAGVLNSLGGNLDSGNTGGFSQPSDLVNTDPLLGPLQDNGGPVFTHAILTGSPAIDAGPATGPSTDARGFPRPRDGDGNGTLLFDIGAFEAESAFALLVDDVTVDENVGTATITVRLPLAVAGGFTVDFMTADGTAVAPGDYASTSGTLTFAGLANETQTFTVSIVDDAVVESAETVLISLSNPSNIIIDVSDTGVLTINDNDMATLTVNDVTVNEDVGTATVMVTVNNAVQGGFTVDFATSDGSAIAPGDYTSTSGTLTFLGTVGETQSFTVPIINDSLAEPTETINIALSNPSVTAVNVSDTAVINIIDDDSATLTVGDVTVDEAAGTATVSVSVSIAVSGGFTVDFATADGTATGGTGGSGDYTISSGTLSFVGNVGEVQTFTVPINNDMIVEATETILVSLSNPSNAAVIATDTGIISITDNDTALLMVSDVTVDESAGSAVVTVSVNNAVQGGFTVDFATVDGTATQPGDYIITTGTLTFLGNVGESQTITIPIISDTVPEPTEQFTVALSNVVTLGSNPAPITSINATDTGIVTITESVINVDLGTTIVDSVDPVLTGGSLTYTVTVTNSGPSAATNVISTTTLPAGLSITSATSPSGMVSFAGGIVTANFTSLGLGAPATITINAIAGSTPGMVTVNTSVTSAETDINLTNNTASESTTINLPTTMAGITGTVFCDANNNGQFDSMDAREVVDPTTVFIDLNHNLRQDSGEPFTTTGLVMPGQYQFDNLPSGNVNVVVAVPVNCNTITDEPAIRRSVVEVGMLARSITSADVNLDGRQDLLVASDLGNSLAIVTNNGDTFLADIRTLPDSNIRPHSVYAYQPDPMQLPTIAVAGPGTPTDSGGVYTMVGQGAFTPRPSTAGPIDVIVEDFNGDTVPDVLSASFRDSIMELRLGGSSGVTTIDVLSQQILSIASGNLVNSTSTREIVVSGYGYGRSTQLEVYGVTGPASSLIVSKLDSIETAPSIVEVAVENIIENPNDPSLDEIVALYHSGKIVVYPMVGGKVGPGVETNVSPGASAFDFGDFNNDGHLDVAIANLGGQFIELYTGAGDGRFALVTTVRNVSAPSDVVVDDFNGDGFDDIAVANFYTDANITNATLPPSFSLPSTATILQLEFASRQVTVTNNTVVEDFRFPTADPIVILDTNGDSRITALDALRVINVLDRQALAEGEQVAAARAATDVNGDGRTSAVDALMIINYLQRDSLAEGNQIGIEDLILHDDEDDRAAILEAFDLALTQGLN